MEKITVNAVGEECPIPVVKATKALGAMKEAGTLEILVNNDVAVQNLGRMAAGYHFSMRVESRENGVSAVVMDVTGPISPIALETAGDLCGLPSSGSFVVAVDTDVMGRGSEELGKTLMKGFLFAVSQLPSLPKTVLFYNGGAHLTCQGSASLEDIKALADKGVDIRTCGTCLNFYGLTDKLEVGSVTNMYEIVETLAQAGKVVKP
ncbi:sulfurtransferase-like selenium metabolism protein YedF [uncultured Oscillibacter sp.]|uniref:sulfurtransferase-like selenium metabolism protein YedF n=1 Tax=uncultured Oscillibacter sp. TaxID=876091 RepID=UPI0025E8560C|nr:sulfurtransferase-like selenium metabolism protein YedF [uncultured Oscillibacter sp.]